MKHKLKGCTELEFSQSMRFPDSAVSLSYRRPSGRSLKVPTCSYINGLCPHSHRERPAPWTQQLLHHALGMAPSRSCSPVTTTTTKWGQLAFYASTSTEAGRGSSLNAKSSALLGSHQSKTLSSQALPPGESRFQPSKRRSFCVTPRLFGCLQQAMQERSKTREVSF